MTSYADGEYVVTVELGAEQVLRFEGYAQNPSDALYKAINQREEEYLREREAEGD